MITLMTGLPRNSKTLYSIGHIMRWAERENRPVYYFGIPELKLPWILINDVSKWHEEVPDGAIVVIDEAQEHFRPIASGREVPPHIQALERHGHRGLDIWFITQHPMLVHTNVRKLTQTHTHAVRIWGAEASTLHTWGGVRENCEKPVARKDSEKSKYIFDKKIYDLYKSSALHTVKLKVPMAVKMIPVLLLLLAGLIYLIYNSFTKRISASDASGVPVAASQLSASPGQRVTRPNAEFDPMQEAQKYVYNQTPRYEGMQHTAPKYDELTAPDVVPMPAACVFSVKRCQCYTQQGTKIESTFNQCLDIAHNGYFMDFNHDGRKNRAQESRRVLNSQESLPISGAATKDIEPRYVAPSYSVIASDVKPARLMP